MIWAAIRQSYIKVKVQLTTAKTNTVKPVVKRNKKFQRYGGRFKDKNCNDLLTDMKHKHQLKNSTQKTEAWVGQPLSQSPKFETFKIGNNRPMLSSNIKFVSIKHDKPWATG